MKKHFIPIGYFSIGVMCIIFSFFSKELHIAELFKASAVFVLLYALKALDDSGLTDKQ